MTMTRKKQHTEAHTEGRGKILLAVFCFMLYILLFFLFAACGQTGQDDPDNPGFEQGIPTEVTFSLSSRSKNQTRAGEDPGTPKDPNAPVELIHDWWIAFVDKNGKVTIQQRGSYFTEGFEAETFKCIIPSGTYDIYAFANIPAKSAEDVKKLIDEESGLESILGEYKFDDDKMQWPQSQNIPMTGFIKNAKIQNTIEETFSIEVIRAVAKIEFDFENPSDEDITLENLSFGRITKSDVSLFPQYNALDNKTAYNPFGTPSYSALNYTFNNTTLAKATGKHNLYFYCKESLAPQEDYQLDGVDYKKDSFRIDLTISKGGTEETKTFYTTTILRHINRNDWIHIPIKFNDWIVIWRLHFYPPIGGYPPVLNQNGNGDNIEATVTTGGEFELYPVQIKRNNQEIDYSTEVDWQHENMAVNVLSESADLFITDRSPKVVKNPGNNDNHAVSDLKFPYIVAGELDPYKTGDAKVQIIFYLKENTNIETEFKCIFTIHRRNPATTNP